MGQVYVTGTSLDFRAAAITKRFVVPGFASAGYAMAVTAVYHFKCAADQISEN